MTNVSPTPPQPPKAPAVPGVRPSAFQAMRAVQMKMDGTAHTEYQQPAHAFIAQVLPDNPELHRQVALPGAKRAVHLEALEAFHARGLSDHEIAAEINQAADSALGENRSRFESWRDGERAEHLADVRGREERRQHLLAAKAAEIEAELDRMKT